MSPRRTRSPVLGVQLQLLSRLVGIPTAAFCQAVRRYTPTVRLRPCVPGRPEEYNFLAGIEASGIHLSYINFGQAVRAEGRLPESPALVLFDRDAVLHIDAQPPLSLEAFEAVLTQPGQSLAVTLPQSANPCLLQLKPRNSEEHQILGQCQDRCAARDMRELRMRLGHCVRHHLDRFKFAQDQADFLARAEHLRVNLLELFSRFVSKAPLPTTSQSTPDPRLIRIAHFIERQLRWDYDSQTLCKLAGMSLRNLYYGFEREFGTTPFRFYRNCKLARVRMALLYDTHQHQPIAWHATNEGFFHLSRFAAQYRGLFGELPSDTVQQVQLLLKGIEPGVCGDPKYPLSRCNPADCLLWGHCQAPNRFVS